MEISRSQAGPGQARHKHTIVLRAGFLCSADFSCFLPGQKIKQIANIEFEEADGGREGGYFGVVVTVSVVQVC